MGALSWLNDVMYDGLPYAITVFSFLITFRYLNFPDLTAAGSFVFGAAVSAISVVHYGVNPYIALVFSVVAGALAGAITGMFHVVLRIDRLLAGILGAFFLYAVNQLLLSPTLPYGAHPTVLSWAELNDRRIQLGHLAWHPYAIGIFLILVVVIKVLLDRGLCSEIGLSLRALEDTDAGEEVLSRNGLSPNAFRFWGVVIANALVGLSGAIISMREGAANAHRGFDVLVTGLIAYMVGMQGVELAQRWVRHRLTGRWPAVTRFLHLAPTSAAVAGTVTYFGLIDLSQRVRVPSEVARVVLVLFVVATVGDWRWLRRLLDRRNTRSARSPLEIETPLLSLRDISFRYEAADEYCLQNQKLEVAAGERILLQGRNGSGKTTLLKIMSGLLTPESGTILLRGVVVTNDTAVRLENIVYVDQNAHRGVVDTLTVVENLRLAQTGAKPSLWRKALDPRATEVLKRLVEAAGFPGSHMERDARTLSGGQRQIVNLLTLSARKSIPSVVLLDEPGNNLDAQHVASCKQIIQQLSARGIAVILVSHSGLEGFKVDRVVPLQACDTEAVPSQ
jgi:putative ABC transport system permease protein